jgi:hypothetical protein
MLTPAGFLEVADRLLEIPDEHCQRTAIGRAYYAASHAAYALAVEAGIVAPGSSLHAVWGRLRALREQPGWSCAGQDGATLKSRREMSDDIIDVDADFAHVAAETVALARDVIARMEALPAPRG